MRSRSLIVTVSLALLVGACTGAGERSLAGMTASTHLAFPVAAGAHAAECTVCHDDTRTFTSFSCVGCHQHDPATCASEHAQVADFVYASQACYGCHRTPYQMASPSGVVSDPARSISVAALVPWYEATSIAGLTAELESLPMGMDHHTGALPGVDTGDCALCHLGASGGVYYPGALHSSLANAQLPQPSSCAGCHAATAPTGFVGPTPAAAPRTPPSGEMKHDAVAWVNGAPTTTPIVTSDCGVCHVSPSASLPATWATSQAGTTPALFHGSLASASEAQPRSCLDCHASSRPTDALTSATAAVAANVSFDHARDEALADCAPCHTTEPARAFVSWSGGRFHLAGSATPATCLPCHAGERPASTATWTSASYGASPFDYVTNAVGISHGDGLDCAVCHAGPGTGAWGGTQDWRGGHFAHRASPVAAMTCIACHTTQRPDLQPGANAAAVAALLGFDHAANGTGDCFGCHQATVSAGSFVSYVYPSTGALPGGDWRGGVSYPGATLVGSPTQLHAMTGLTLVRAGPASLVTGMSATAATLYDQMLHTSTAIPAALSAGSAASPDDTKCWHCHTNTNGVVTSLAEGRYHASLTKFSATPGGPVTPVPQPTSQCSDCHAATRPPGIVEASGSNLQPMDHEARFAAPVVLGGASVGGVLDMDCSACHHSPTTTWADGVFHSAIGSAVPADCVACHYPLVADTARADVTSGTSYRMVHGSTQVAFQACQSCHAGALARSTQQPLAPASWKTGLYHASVAAQPTACLGCHSVSQPPATAPTASAWSYGLAAGATSTNTAQWMNHGASSVAGLDCVRCHALDAKASGSAWSRSGQLHAQVSAPTACRGCHGLTNGGGSVVGTNNNMPAGLTSSSTVSTAAQDPSTGVSAGTLDQITHADVNVSGHDCNFCHTQAGVSTTQGIAGKEWAQARFHASFSSATPLVIDGSSGRCSNCHMNVKPGPAFAAQDHSAFSAAPGSQDCSACHSWPGTGTTATPNWLGASAMPQFIAVGGFAIPRPPATAATTQAGINNLPHPAASGTSCGTCHPGGVGGKGAIGYDHASTLIASSCNACHEAGTNLLGAPWNGATSQAAGAGDSRPFTLTSVVARRGTSSSTCTVTTANHFYPVDCKECHAKPAGNGPVTTGSAYTTAWIFPHQTSLMSNPTTCNMCHNASCSK